ncbi:hypothetical protein [Candidatus Chloroploca asiatica]|uniref:Uncharacterized protein n=1 Tax=Candidatus Chloroploca asiatica TaxID=1506545 RepID=A0A2H3KVJ7_9CHLR|nr:hypothetical protein [Candidatus Chloroploca asiatica]PDV97906.1 hypothetical protein A9Q02_16915 [Candidatus Chloroploca asiatica]
MNRSITFRTQIAINTVTLCLVAFMLLASNTFANSNVANTVSSTTTTTISYQGHLTSPDGTAVSATLPMTFNLYTGPTGGTAVWTEQRSGSNAVPVSNGLFNVALGSVTPIPVSLLNAPLWLGISVNSDAEMSPREQLASVPYAAVAGNVPDGSITQLQAPSLVRSANDTNVRLYHGKKTMTSQGSQNILQFSITLSPPCKYHFEVFLQPSWTYHNDVISSVGGTPDGFTAYFRLADGRSWSDGQWLPVDWLAICSDN